ncbi:hypothetical protein PV08_03729 [Exophiala spinifera]|uniref:Nucleotide-diphospho-sugar transferase domain-containing protein n=1 Tax=Exophiala spinifera TaxID=91928 RepID=A0A0D1YNA9_9EURO|nr:uncharacterized protein PV08_03729 [Exophiala spinifera]KIW16541.1 hypothetical protein PV08_03729 [Exophiala spinifera]
MTTLTAIVRSFKQRVLLAALLSLALILLGQHHWIALRNDNVRQWGTKAYGTLSEWVSNKIADVETPESELGAVSADTNGDNFSGWLHAQGISQNEVPIITIGDSNYIQALRNLRARLDLWGYGRNLVVLCLDEACLKEKSYHGWRVHMISNTKFTITLELAQNGYNFVFLDGDVFLTGSGDPFMDMLPLSDQSWDIQFQDEMDIFRRIANIGWFFAKASTATKHFFQSSYDRWLETNAWDQNVMNDIIGEMGDSLKVHYLSLSKFRNFINVDWLPFFALENLAAGFVEESPMVHYTCVEKGLKTYFGANFGGYADLDGYYSNPPPLLGMVNVAGSTDAVLQQIAFAVEIAQRTNRTLLWPNSVSLVQRRIVDGRSEFYADSSFPGIRVLDYAQAQKDGIKTVESRYLQNQQREIGKSLCTPHVVDVGDFLRLQGVPRGPQDLTDLVHGLNQNVVPILDFDNLLDPAYQWLRNEDASNRAQITDPGFEQHFHEAARSFEMIMNLTGITEYSAQMQTRLQLCPNVENDQDCLAICASTHDQP